MNVQPETAKTYLITGATGLLGNNVARRLLQQGHNVRVLLRGRVADRSLDGLPVHVMTGDLCDSAAVASAVEGVDRVIHAAGDLHIGWKHWDRIRQVNVEGTRVIAESCRRADARLVHVSTVDTILTTDDGTPADESHHDPLSDRSTAKVPCTYCVTKREAEHAVHQQRERGLDAVIVHPGFMLGPYDWKPSSGRMLLAVAHGGTWAAPTGGMSSCDVRDVAAGIQLASEKGQCGRHYILSGENLSYLDAWRRFAEVTGGTRPRLCMGPLVRWIAGYGGDMFAKLIGNEPDVNSAMIRMSSLFNYYSSQRAEEELGYRCRPFEQSVRDAWDWFKSRPDIAPRMASRRRKS